MTDQPQTTEAFPGMRVRMVRPGYLGIQISSTEYVMPVCDANELVGMIQRAKHDGIVSNDHET